MMGPVVFREVDRTTWTDFAALFEERGGPKSCWCMLWRASRIEAKKHDGGSRRTQMNSRVAAGVPVGILAYANNKPVAWCSIAPRQTYRELGGPEEHDEDECIWSLACFFIKRDYRGHGLLGRLISAAVAHATRRGATVVEAYPVDADSPSYRFMGFVEAFVAAGFREIRRAGKRRHVMRLVIRDLPRRTPGLNSTSGGENAV
jgi:GNAT superfamily N-acetyltransferase